mgnify:FL=1
MADDPPPPPQLGPPPEVVFSAPTAGEVDVVPTTNVRIQFSRDLDQTTLKSRVQVEYVDGGIPGGAVLPP